MPRSRTATSQASSPVPPAPALLTAQQLADKLGWRTSTVWRNVASGRLPKPIYVGSRSPRWREDELMQALNSLQASPTEAKAARRAASIAAAKNDETRAA